MNCMIIALMCLGNTLKESQKMLYDMQWECRGLDPDEDRETVLGIMGKYGAEDADPKDIFR